MNIPSVLRYLLCLNWLENLASELVCFDETTVRRDILGYARALIEVKPDRLLPSVLLVEPTIGQVEKVDTDYKWKPPICFNFILLVI